MKPPTTPRMDPDPPSSRPPPETQHRYTEPPAGRTRTSRGKRHRHAAVDAAVADRNEGAVACSTGKPSYLALTYPNTSSSKYASLRSTRFPTPARPPERPPARGVERIGGGNEAPLFRLLRYCAEGESERMFENRVEETGRREESREMGNWVEACGGRFGSFALES